MNEWEQKVRADKSKQKNKNGRFADWIFNNITEISGKSSQNELEKTKKKA